MRFLIILCSFICLSLCSCLTVIDEVNINEKGAGTVTYSVDMIQLMSTMSTLGGEEFQKELKTTDNTFQLYKLFKKDPELTKEERKLFQAATCRKEFNLKKEKAMLTIKFPVESYVEINQLNKAIGEGKFGITRIVNQTLDPEQKEQAENGENFDLLLGIYDYNFEKDQITRRASKTRLLKLMDDPESKNFTSYSEMGVEIPHRIVYHLPRPVKSVSFKGAKLSDDRKTITIEGDLLSVLKLADAMDFTIKY